jgi:hypothetical protein
MSNEVSVIEGNELPTHEVVARAILPRFPNSTLKMDENLNGVTFDIYYGEKLLLSLNKRGARYYFPTRRKRMITWHRVGPAAVPRVVEYILRDLAEADYQVFTSADREIRKRPIHISRYKRCPQCKSAGGIKMIVRAESVGEQDAQLYTAVSRSIDINGAEIKCVLCGWIGVRGELLRRG